jgi:RNA polymerase sigma-70 factor (ECF subfamily)
MKYGRFSGVAATRDVIALSGGRSLIVNLFDAEASRMPVVTGEELAMAVAPVSRDDLIVELFRRRGPVLIGLARSLVDSREEAEEVVQEAFARLGASFMRIDDSGRADRYLTVTVLNLARSRLRRRRTAREKDHLLRSGDDYLDDWQSDDDVRRVRVAIQSLPRRQQQCVALRFYYGASEREIGEALGMSTGSVKQHLSRARSALAASLGDRP